MNLGDWAKQWFPPACPICRQKLRLVEGSRNRRCAAGHEFGPDMKRVDLINAGDHHGPI